MFKNIQLCKMVLFTFCFLFIVHCNKQNGSITSPISDTPQYETVFSHNDGDLCYYPRVSNDGKLLAIEREEIVPKINYAAHIWLHNMKTDESRQITTNPETGYNDDRNLRFSENDKYIYFLRTHWKSDGNYERFLCRVSIIGNENDVEILPDGEKTIYRFDFITDESNLLIAFYDQNEYKTGLLNSTSGEIDILSPLTGLRHNALVSLPDGKGFIAASGDDITDVVNYKLYRHYFDGNATEEYQSIKLNLIVWVLSIEPGGDNFLLHQGVCTSSSTFSLPIDGGNSIYYLQGYSVPRDAYWGPDNYIYFTYYGDVLRCGPLE